MLDEVGNGGDGELWTKFLGGLYTRWQDHPRLHPQHEVPLVVNDHANGPHTDMASGGISKSVGSKTMNRRTSGCGERSAI